MDCISDGAIAYEVKDERQPGRMFQATFRGELRDEQKPALQEMLKHDNGILHAATAFGKTVVCSALIAERKVNTLIILESSSLIEQWEESLARFLDINEKLPEYKTKTGRIKTRKSLIGTLQGAHDSMTGNNSKREHNHWLTLFVVLFGTGMRVGEVCGLRWQDLDFEKREISINHNLLYTRWDGHVGKETFHISTPKTAKGTRMIPMTDEVYEAFKAEYDHQTVTGFCESEVDGMSGFVFCNRFRGVLHQGPINRAIKRVYTCYNNEEVLRAAKEKRKPLIIPHFSCHHIRHTFCTRLCERETNIKAIQEIMGHADAQNTLDIYAEATSEVKHEAIKALRKQKDVN